MPVEDGEASSRRSSSSQNPTSTEPHFRNDTTVRAEQTHDRFDSGSMLTRRNLEQMSSRSDATDHQERQGAFQETLDAKIELDDGPYSESARFSLPRWLRGDVPYTIPCTYRSFNARKAILRFDRFWTGACRSYRICQCSTGYSFRK